MISRTEPVRGFPGKLKKISVLSLVALARCTAHQHFRVAAKRARSTCGAPVLDRRTLALLRLARPTCISPARANRRNLSARTPSGVLCLARSRCAMDHDDASRVRGNRANVEVALDRVANLAEPGAQSASYEDESLIHGNSTATSPDLTRAVGDSQAMVSGPDTPAARENSDGHRNSPRKMPRVASSPALPTRATAPRPGSREMRDLFFVRPDAVNFNASYGTPAREVRPRTTDSSRATTFSRTGALTFEENDRSPGNSRLQRTSSQPDEFFFPLE